MALCGVSLSFRIARIQQQKREAVGTGGTAQGAASDRPGAGNEDEIGLAKDPREEEYAIAAEWPTSQKGARRVCVV